MRLRWSAVRTIAAAEFRMRIRAGRWRWLLVAWFVALAIFTALLWAGARALSSLDQPIGPVLFGGLMLFVLALAMLVVPALGAQSVNGDKERGTLAPLQVTLLAPAEIALGKLVAAWGTSLVFLALTLPLVAWSMLEGGLPVLNVAVVLLVVALLLGVVAAIAQCLSALLPRTTTSAVLSYLAVFGLGLGTVIAFGLVTAVVEAQWTDRADGTSVTSPTQRTWVLLAPNPFVILADAAPAVPQRRDARGVPIGQPLDPLGGIGNAVRELRNPPAVSFDESTGEGGVVDGTPGTSQAGAGGAVWPWGLGFDLLLAAGAVAVTTRRLRTPSGSLQTGVRVA